MNKFLNILVVFFTSASLLQAQDYVRVKRNFDGRGITFFEGEIYPYVGTKNHFMCFIANGKEYQAKDDVEILQNAQGVQNREAEKNMFVKKGKDGESILIDMSSVDKGNNIVWLANLNTKLASIDKTFEIEYERLGNTFRLIIPNTVTIWYDTNKLESFPWWWILIVAALI